MAQLWQQFPFVDYFADTEKHRSSFEMTRSALCLLSGCACFKVSYAFLHLFLLLYVVNDFLAQTRA